MDQAARPARVASAPVYDRAMPAPLVMDYDHDQRRIEELIDALPRPLEVLEAGCGRLWTLNLVAPYRVTGIDLDRDALRARFEDEGDLDEAIVGDIRTADLPAARYDVIYCSFVLEHVDGAETVLRNFDRWLRPGGLLIVKVPDRGALYGLAARMTPHWFHVWYYRAVRKVKTAGTPGHGPYPTHYDPIIARPGFEAFCRERGLVLRETLLVDNYIRGSRVLRWLGRFVGIVSAGRIPWRWNDLTFIVSKPGGS